MVATAFAAELAAFHTARRSALRPYPGVAETLAELKQRGTLIACQTESPAIYGARPASRVGGGPGPPRHEGG